MGYCWNHIGEPVLIAGAKPLLTDFGIDWRVGTVIEWVYLESTDDADNDKPEPEEDVDFLVDDVQGEDAESVKPLNSTRRTELVEGAFSHLGKHPGYEEAKRYFKNKKPFYQVYVS